MNTMSRAAALLMVISLLHGAQAAAAERTQRRPSAVSFTKLSPRQQRALLKPLSLQQCVRLHLAVAKAHVQPVAPISYTAAGGSLDVIAKHVEQAPYSPEVRIKVFRDLLTGVCPRSDTADMIAERDIVLLDAVLGLDQKGTTRAVG